LTDGGENVPPAGDRAGATRAITGIDLLIRGGHVVDPSTGLDGPNEVAIAGGRIAAVGLNLDGDASTTIDARGLIVTPGLVDLHTHVYADATYWGVDPDGIGPRTGVTTFIDAGSAGAYTLRAFRSQALTRRSSRVLAFANIAVGGLTTPSFELANIDDCDPAALPLVAPDLGDFIRGVKVRMGVPIALGHGLEPLRRALDAAERLGVPVMCHIATGPPAIADVIRLLRPGDVLTHAFTGQSMRLTGDDRRSIAAAQEARAAGVVLDLGHGSGGFSFETATTLAEAGILPDTISTDLHQLSVNGPMFDLPTCMTKMLALGMSLREVVSAASARPAAVVGLTDGTGSLAVGAAADVAILGMDTGTFTLADVHHRTITSSRRLRSVTTIFGGSPVPRSTPDAPAPWVELTAGQRAYYDRRDPDALMADLVSIEDLAPALARDGDPERLMADAVRGFGVAADPSGSKAGVSSAGVGR
jgi:dihydroorotase